MSKKKTKILYRPSSTETILFIVLAVLSGVYYFSNLVMSKDPFVAITTFFMVVLVGYVALIAFNSTITRYLAITIAKLKIKQIKLVVKEACGKELNDEEAIELASKVNELATKKTRKEDEKEQEN